jgi:hypothetical protein
MRITSEDFKKYFKKEQSNYFKKEIKSLEYQYLNQEDEKEKILEIIKTVIEKNIKKSGKSYKKKWNSGWNENYNLFKKSKKIKDLIPKYFFKNKISRIGNKLIKTKSKNFDYKILRLITLYIFLKYLKKESNIVEFGCGTGHNLLALSKINKAAIIYGLDWAQSSQKILKIISQKYKKISGHRFNYFNPKLNNEINLKKNDWSCFTVASLEQLGNDFLKFLNFLKKNKPKIIINIEPINELMSQDKILDYLSVKYSKKRNYLDNYYNYLKKLEKNKIIKIIEVKKSYFGSFYINGYSIIVWKFIK